MFKYRPTLVPAPHRPLHPTRQHDSPRRPQTRQPLRRRRRRRPHQQHPPPRTRDSTRHMCSAGGLSPSSLQAWQRSGQSTSSGWQWRQALVPYLLYWSLRARRRACLSRYVRMLTAEEGISLATGAVGLAVSSYLLVRFATKRSLSSEQRNEAATEREYLRNDHRPSSPSGDPDA